MLALTGGWPVRFNKLLNPVENVTFYYVSSLKVMKIFAPMKTPST